MTPIQKGERATTTSSILGTLRANGWLIVLVIFFNKSQLLLGLRELAVLYKCIWPGCNKIFWGGQSPGSLQAHKD
jgi:hypothetical protein